MAVTVVLGRYNQSAQIAIRDDIEDARSIRVTDDGHLLVMNGVSNAAMAIAIYKPGSWQSAFVDEALTSAESA